MRRSIQERREIPVTWKDEQWKPKIEHRGEARCARIEAPGVGARVRRPRHSSGYIVRYGNLWVRSETRSTWR